MLYNDFVRFCIFPICRIENTAVSVIESAVLHYANVGDVPDGDCVALC